MMSIRQLATVAILVVLTAAFTQSAGIAEPKSELYAGLLLQKRSGERILLPSSKLVGNGFYHSWKSRLHETKLLGTYLELMDMNGKTSVVSLLFLLRNVSRMEFMTGKPDLDGHYRCSISLRSGKVVTYKHAKWRRVVGNYGIGDDGTHYVYYREDKDPLTGASRTAKIRLSDLRMISPIHKSLPYDPATEQNFPEDYRFNPYTGVKLVLK